VAQYTDVETLVATNIKARKGERIRGDGARRLTAALSNTKLRRVRHAENNVDEIHAAAYM